MKPRWMAIALDYDDTYTVDPEFWAGVVAAGEARGHTFVCVTARSAEDAAKIDIGLQVIATAGRPKAEIARNMGVEIDVWIDDWPELIGRTRPA